MGDLGQLGMFGGRDMLQSTNVVLPLGGSTDPDAGALARRRWTVFGQGDIQTFRGESAAAGATYEGDLRSAYAGVDARLGEQWLAGVALARSFGAGSWRLDGANGRLETVMTAVHPYVQWSRGRTSIWAVGGMGRGTAERLADTGGGGDAADLGLSLGLVEARRQVAVVAGGIQLGLGGEVSFARLATGAGSDVLGDLEAGVHRTRAGFDASSSWSSAGGLSVEPFGRVSTRHDSGAGQTGVGLEVEAGARVNGGILRIEAQARTLAMHTAAQYEESGGSVTVSVGEEAQRPGLTLSLAPRWGAAQGADMLWQDQVYRPFGLGPEMDNGAVDPRVSYGLRLPKRLLVAPFGTYGSGYGGRRLQVGASLGAIDTGAGTPVQVEFSGERYSREMGH